MNEHPAPTHERTHLNGLEIQAALGTIEAIEANPDLARFQFRARNTWIDGSEAG